MALTQPHPSGCILWTGRLKASSPCQPAAGGYGQFRVKDESTGTWRTVNGHRWILEQTLGRPLLPGMDAAHTCNVRACVNPAHLFEQSHTENAREALARRWSVREALDWQGRIAHIKAIAHPAYHPAPSPCQVSLFARAEIR